MVPPGVWDCEEFGGKVSFGRYTHCSRGWKTVKERARRGSDVAGAVSRGSAASIPGIADGLLYLYLLELCKGQLLYSVGPVQG